MKRLNVKPRRKTIDIIATAFYGKNNRGEPYDTTRKSVEERK